MRKSGTCWRAKVRSGVKRPTMRRSWTCVRASASISPPAPDSSSATPARALVRPHRHHAPLARKQRSHSHPRPLAPHLNPLSPLHHLTDHPPYCVIPIVVSSRGPARDLRRLSAIPPNHSHYSSIQGWGERHPTGTLHFSIVSSSSSIPNPDPSGTSM